MAAITICSDFGAQKNKVWHCFHCFPIYFPWSDETRAMIFLFWMLSFKTTFWLSSFIFIKRLFTSSSLSAIRVVSSAYLRLLIFLQAILIPACASFSPAFLMMYSACKLDKIRSDQISLSVVSKFLQPHETQHSRPPCPSPAPRVHSDSCPSSQWCHPAISSSVVPLLHLPPIPPSIRVFSNESTLLMRWPKYWSFSFSIIPSKETPGLSSSIVSLDWP